MVVREMRQTRLHLASLLVASYLRQATHVQTELKVSTSSQENTRTVQCQEEWPAWQVPPTTRSGRAGWRLRSTAVTTTWTRLSSPATATSPAGLSRVLLHIQVDTCAGVT